MNLEMIKNLIVSVTNMNGDRISGRLADYDRTHITLVFRSGITAYMAISDIKFIVPLKKQPDPLQVV